MYPTPTVRTTMRAQGLPGLQQVRSPSSHPLLSSTNRSTTSHHRSSTCTSNIPTRTHILHSNSSLVTTSVHNTHSSTISTHQQDQGGTSMLNNRSSLLCLVLGKILVATLRYKPLNASWRTIRTSHKKHNSRTTCCFSSNRNISNICSSRSIGNSTNNMLTNSSTTNNSSSYRRVKFRNNIFSRDPRSFRSNRLFQMTGCRSKVLSCPVRPKRDTGDKRL
mmetsp:Transcript_22653/g.31972  ORF Transcript_22653/g.31972 Transcript_22653/m.31972 type:complete len:220 (+) Transcript_22653:614-1273(+)